MRPKRPVRPPPAPPPLPAVVTPENLDAINTPAVDELPAYISVGKFQWKPPLPGPKGDTGEKGDKGDPGAITRPISPPVTTTEIEDDAVEKAKIKNGNVSPPKLEAVAPPADTEIPSYDSASGKFLWVPPPAAPPPPLLPQIIEPPAGTLWSIFLRGASVGKVGDLLSLKLMAKNVDMPADDWAAWELNNLEYDTGRMTLESVEEGDGIFDWKIKTTYPPLWAVRALLAPPPYQPDAGEDGLRLLTLNFRLTAAGSAYFKFNAVTIQFADGSAVPYPATTLDSVVSIVA